ncbi:MAG TPA: Ig-like domain-containing protein [Verrucomicrobiae bacterium]|jgi:hypothetical protein
MTKNLIANRCVSGGKLLFGIAALAGALLTASHATAQTTNAYDQASDPVYAGLGAPNGLNTGGQNGGFGFNPWAITLTGNGGAFIQNNGPSGDSIDLWNTGNGGSTVAVRPFGSAMTAGQSFSVQLRLNSLDNISTTNMLALQDASGNTIFSYWHYGNEANGATNGWYSDASTTKGVAVGFTYNYQHFNSFTFTLNSPTTYTFLDATSGRSFTGTISGAPIAQVAFIRANATGYAPGGGQDFQIDQLALVSSTPPVFTAQTPAANSYSASRTNVISVQVIPGSTPINPDSITLSVDGVGVATSVSTVSGVSTVSYLPSSPLSAGTLHTVQMTMADNNNGLFTNSWSFTTGFSSLPATLPGPIAATGTDITIFTAAGDDWLGTNYNTSSSRTIYARFSMAFHDLNGETGTGGGFGGLQLLLGNNEKPIVGNNWTSLNWSLDAQASGIFDLSPVTPVVLDEWHTIVERVDYSPGGNATLTVWLDPDLTQTEVSQPNAPTIVSADATFDNIRLRCGNGTANCTFSNITMSATTLFKAPAAPAFQGFVPGINAPSAPVGTPISATVLFGSYGIDQNNVTLTLDGTPVTPTFVVTTNSITVNYQPASPFTPNSAHTATLSVTDANGASYSTSWSFTADAYPSLPITLAGPFDVSGGGLGLTIVSNLNGAIGNNYGTTSTNTLYTQFSMVFYDINGESADDVGGCFGGLHFYTGTNEKLLTGETWLRNSWSCDDKMGGETGETNLLPMTTVVVGEWHTMVVKNQFQAEGNTLVTVWLDPDFTKSETGQANPPFTVAMDDTFDTIRLRAGNGSAFAEYTNVVLTATSPFAAPTAPGLLTITANQLSWTGGGTLQSAPAVTGPWTDFGNSNNPQTLSTTNSAQFFRLRQ